MSDTALSLDASILDPSILVIFGITGDLAKRKVLPALYHLMKDNLLPEQLAIIGTSRREMSIDELLKNIELCVLEADNVCDPDVMNRFREKVEMLKLDPVIEADYDTLHDRMDAIEEQHNVCMNRLFYLSIPPQVFGSLVGHLGSHGLATGCKHEGGASSRLLVEKPFGYDLISAQDLINSTAEHFSEAQVFRIDHYLAKETAQNILAFRRYNPLFSAVWNKDHIKSIEIVAAEKIGIEGRADFYEQVGAMRDLIQSHLMQLLAITTMELPEDLSNSDAIHEKKQVLFDDIKHVAPDQVATKVVRGQYEGYREEVKNNDSVTETFVSIQLAIGNKRWENVPIILKTGKALSSKKTEITLTFGRAEGEDLPNVLSFRIQPNEGIDAQLIVKKPGFAMNVQPASMDFSYQATFDETGHPEAYERVLIDAIRGDHTLFATSSEVLASWRVLQPILDEWRKDPKDLQFYSIGSDGPDDPHTA